MNIMQSRNTGPGGEDFGGKRKQKDMNWDDCPVGTKAYSVNGGYWTKIRRRGWKWCTGDTFPTPGGDAVSVSFPSPLKTPTKPII